ncbi:MAG: double-strand break repair protein AddB [Methylobacteriaceae bacterium]|nr:double-strand break repair protein AddB [Methylobacteriaceae bacterium]
MARPRLFTIPPGVPYLATFVRALLDGDILPGLSHVAGPLALTDLTIYVPTRRATRALIAEFAAQSERGATLLPTIRPLGAVDEEASLFAEPDEAFVSFDPSIPPAIGEIERRFLLASLVHRWSQQLRGAIVGVGQNGEIITDATQALVVGATPADALALAGELADLIDEFIVEGADWSAIRRLAAEDYDRYWGISAEFLKIAIELWPDILRDRGAIDLAARRARLIDREAARLAELDEPTIVLGSTGTNRATAKLMGAIARIPRGAVILPGLDDIMPEQDWRLASGAGEVTEPAHGHPQAALARLLTRLEVSREDVRALAAPDAMLNKRRRFVSQALAPSESTPDWRAYVAAHGNERADALADVCLVEAADEREEALAIAICLREALETPEKTAALITPDRAIARRVRAELARWGLHVDDSGGEPLGATPAGAFARAVLSAATERSDVAFLALLGHSGVAPTQDRARTLELAQHIEIAVLRATPCDPDWRARFNAARDSAHGRHAHAAVRRLAPGEWEEMEMAALAIDSALASLRAAPRAQTVGAWIALHRAALRALGAHAVAGYSEDEVTLERLFDEVGAMGGEAESELRFGLYEYRALFDRLVSGVVSRGPQLAHPRLKILGLLEARLLEADLVVLAGLDETIWPPQPRSDAFLNRPMRAQIGLTPPERRIGQSAHDFAMAMGAREVVLTRAQKRARAPTVASRFLQRLGALAGDVEFDGLRARGARLIALARLLDASPAAAPLTRPAPKPPVELRPKSLSVTRIETLRRDPYAIYAERILRLQPLERLDFAIGASEQGTSVHLALAEFVRRWPGRELPSEARDFLVSAAREHLAPFFADPAWRAFRWPALEAGLDYLLGYEAGRRPEIDKIVAEARGKLPFTLSDGSEFTLTAEADRIEIDRAGHARIIDYKTGEPPSKRQIEIGLAAQLTLEAAMVLRGAFAEISAAGVEGGAYIKLGGKNGGKIVPSSPEEMNIAELAETHFMELNKLLSSFREPEQGYPSRALAQFIKRAGDFDHLARVKEWSASGGVGVDEG